MTRKALFIDRDGTLILEPSDEQVDSLEKLEFYPGVFTWLGRIARETDYELVMVTNQDGLGTNSFPEESFWPAHNKLLSTLAGESIHFKEVLIDRSTAEEGKATRKPGTGLLQRYLTGEFDLGQSFVIGDRLTDMHLAKNLGAKGFLLTQRLSAGLESVLSAPGVTVTESWEAIYRYLASSPRETHVNRQTSETKISIRLCLDGRGTFIISTGLHFLDHMIEQLARHGSLDLSVKADGDLQVDEHHTVEDTALALGQAFSNALGSRRGIARYGFVLPMDDCLAQVAIDFGGRPWLEWDAEFRREKIGDVPTEMFHHFFKSFCDQARCNVHVRATGTNEHHKIEAIFKAFAKSIKMAVRKEGVELPTTKGII